MTPPSSDSTSDFRQEVAIFALTADPAPEQDRRRSLNRTLKNLFAPRLLKKVHMQGGA